jgi:general stress protein 26
MTMDAKQQKEYCLGVIKTSPACYLATINEKGSPEIRAMLNLRNPQAFPGLREFFTGLPDDFTVYLTTNTSSTKMRQMRNNPRVALYYCNPASWQGVMLAGAVEIVVDPETKKALWQPNWNLYYPQGPADPDYTIARLRPETAKAYGNLGTFAFAPETV